MHLKKIKLEKKRLLIKTFMQKIKTYKTFIELLSINFINCIDRNELLDKKYLCRIV